MAGISFLFKNKIKAIRLAIFLSVFLVTFLGVAGNVRAASKIADIDFENSLVNSLGGAVAVGNPTGTPLEAEQIVSYVPGINGLAARSSHNDDDDAGDLTIQIPFPETDEVYIKWWVKYEPEYWGLCSNSIWNVKWFWTGAGTYVNHTENIFQSYSNGNIGFNSYQSEPNVDSFSDNGVAYVFGDWMKVETYWKQSSGSGTNADGIFRLTVNDEISINETALITGDIGDEPIYSPALKASCDCLTGEGWWQLDDFEVWDGLPEEGDDIIAPESPSGLFVW